ncbi:hypothetical protein GF389_05760, partial [Candidatus Dojkabacteria bacterium]|nr:hypothetical protein [Candidatus Dojkabacteria bacterium]
MKKKFQDLSQSEKIMLCIALFLLVIFIILLLLTAIGKKDDVPGLPDKDHSVAEETDAEEPFEAAAENPKKDSETEIIEKEPSKNIYSLAITGDVTLPQQNSLVRVILTDSQDNEYLVYEGYPLIAQSDNYSIRETCEESCYLDGITLKNVKTYTENGGKINIQALGKNTITESPPTPE